MAQSSGFANVVAAIVVAVGLAASGWLVGTGIENMRALDRYVTVKGLAERDVRADKAVWPITYVATDDVLQNAQAKIDADTNMLFDFSQATALVAKPQSCKTCR